jgi:hypothetical protein
LRLFWKLFDAVISSWENPDWISTFGFEFGRIVLMVFTLLSYYAWVGKQDWNDNVGRIIHLPPELWNLSKLCEGHGLFPAQHCNHLKSVVSDCVHWIEALAKL